MEKLLFIYNNPLDGSYGGSQRTKQALQGLSKHFNSKRNPQAKPVVRRSALHG